MFDRIASWRLPEEIQPLVERLIAAGTHGYDGETKRRLRVLNLICYLIAIATFIYALQYVMIDAVLFAPVIAINFALVVLALLVPLVHRVHEVAGGLLLAVSECIAIYTLSQYLGRDAGLQLQLFVLAAAPFLILGLKRMWLIALVVVSALAVHLAAWFFLPPQSALLVVDAETIDLLYVNASITTILLIAATVYYAYYQTDKAHQEVDRLLLNILPASIVVQLKENPGEEIAVRVEDASVLFIDLVGFTPLASELGPARTVELLGTMFSALDELVSQHGVEKIKTIGDAYMIAGGVPQTDPEHLHKIARVALAVSSCVEKSGDSVGVDVQSRVGFASGCVMAGVIGTKKFSYDIWGQTVNIASRMESNSKPGAVMVPLDVKQKLQDDFSFQPAGVKQIKGEGEMECWYLIREKP